MPSPPRSPSKSFSQLFSKLQRDTKWTLVSMMPLDFPIYHPQGLAMTPRRIFISSVEVFEAPVWNTSGSPRANHDRTIGRGLGHIFVIDRHSGKLEEDIRLVEGALRERYHPGGINYDGKHIWVSLAEYRPNSSSAIYRIDSDTLKVTKVCQFLDHYGGVIHDRGRPGRLILYTWGSRHFHVRDTRGEMIDKWTNGSWFTDWQDGTYAGNGKIVCSGVSKLRANNVAQEDPRFYELGGIALIDLQTHQTLHEVPIQVYSDGGHVMTRNPVEITIEDGRLTLYAAPDDDDTGSGTHVYKYVAEVT